MNKKFQYWGLGFATGFLVACLVAGYIIGHQKYQPTRVYEDGSFYGCVEGGLCND